MDGRNVMDEFKGMSHEEIVRRLDERGVELEIGIENLERDFSMGTIVRNANAFGVRHVHVIGRKQWNKRGAMATDKYLYVHYHASVSDFVDMMKMQQKSIVAIDNVAGSKTLTGTSLPPNAVMVFGQEGTGISPEMIIAADMTVAIEQLGSTRSINVGVAAGIAMYAWMQQHSLGVKDIQDGKVA